MAFLINFNVQLILMPPRETRENEFSRVRMDGRVDRDLHVNLAAHSLPQRSNSCPGQSLNRVKLSDDKIQDRAISDVRSTRLESAGRHRVALSRFNRNSYVAIIT